MKETMKAHLLRKYRMAAKNMQDLRDMKEEFMREYGITEKLRRDSFFRFYGEREAIGEILIQYCGVRESVLREIQREVMPAADEAVCPDE